MQKSTPVRWKSEKVFHEGDGFFSRLIEEISQAKKSITFETYIFEDDSLGQRIAEGLICAAHRGVHVRLMVDGFGSPLWGVKFLDKMIAEGINARIYNPLPWSYLQDGGKPGSASIMLRILARLNRRNHRKTCIIDRKSLWIGSMNVCDNHLKSQLGNRSWRDTSLRLEGASVIELERAFNKTWNKAWSPSPDRHRSKHLRQRSRIKRSGGLVRLNDSWLSRRRLYDNLIDRVSTAKEKVWITSAYFLPPNSLVMALCKAASRGADVRILISKDYDIFFFKWVSSVFYFSLLNAGVKIYEYAPSILHAKVLILDDAVIVGSSNLNHRSFIHDLEADVFLTDESIKQEIRKQFLNDLQVADDIHLESCLPATTTEIVSTSGAEIQPRVWDSRLGFEGLAGKLLFHLRYWM